MKTQHLIPILLLAICCALSAQTTNSNTNTNTSAPQKTMSYTLTFVLENNQKKIPNPTEADIRAAMHTPVSDDVGGIFYIGLDGTDDLLQIEANGKGHFNLSYVPSADGKGSLYSKRDNFTFEEALKILLAYRNGEPGWKKLLEWKS